MRLWLLFIFISSAVFSQNEKQYPSLLWKISGNGLKKPSYVYGTMHVSNKVAWHLSDQFFDALKSVDVVGLETNPAEWLQNMEATGELEKISHSSPSFPYQSNFYESIFKWDFPDRKVLQAVLRYDPDIINGLLFRKSTSRDNFEENTYVDLFIFQMASKIGKKVISLEDFFDAEIQSKLANEPDEKEGEDYQYQLFNTGATSIEDAYREGNLDLLDSLSHRTSTKNTQKFLIEARNVYFANTIDSVIKSKSIFSGVGAAHLPGANGLIELLRKKGYILEPVFGKTTHHGEKEKLKIDQIEKPLTFSKQLSSDSAFSIELPAKLYTIYESPALSYQIQPDMINGHFFTAVRLRHYGSIFGYSALAMKARIDSLLFEGIAGRIIEKHDLSSNTGKPGMEVLAKTKNGDVQRYQFYFDENEMYLFKLSAKSDYAASKLGNAYFKGINFLNGPANAFLYQPPEAGFKMMLKGKSNYQAKTGLSIGVVQDLISFDKGATIFMQQAVYNDFNYLEEDTFELGQLAKNILENYQYNLDGSYSFHQSQGLPSVRFQAKSANGSRLDGKIIIKGVHYYLVLMSSKLGTEIDYSSFDSFQLQDFKYLNPFKKIKDQEFLFSVEDEVSDDAASRFEERYAREKKLALPKKDPVSISDAGFRSDVKQYYSPSSNEYVNITFEKYNYYDHRDKTELVKKIDAVYTSQNSMNIAERQIKDVGDRFQYQFVLKDTATSRAIFVKLFFQNSTLHEISASYDTVLGLKGWTKNFINTFVPLDSAAGPSIFKAKIDQLLSDLISKDSVTNAQAKLALEEIVFEKGYSTAFIKFIQSPPFALLDEAIKSQLLVNGGTMACDDLNAPYRSLYKRYDDSLFLQLSVLKGLAYSKTEKTAQTFYDLILDSPPLSGDENLIFDVFSVYNDSLELCKNFFPDFLNLTRYEEYKNPVLALLAAMIDKKLVSTELLKNTLPFIVADANLTLKRMKQAKQLNKDNSTSKNYDLAAILNYNGSQESEPEAEADLLKDKSPLLNYLTVIAPFYNIDQRAKIFIDKILLLKELDIVMPALIEVMKYVPNVNDSLFMNLCNSEISRAVFYHQLKKIGLQQKFPTSKWSQADLVTSLVKTKTLSQNFTFLTEKTSKDSLILLSTQAVQNRYQKGLLYVYNQKGTGKFRDTWRVAFVPDQADKLTDQIEVYSQLYYVDQTKSEKENIQELVSRFALLYRERVKVTSPF